jgi:hypothetical protein
MADGKANVGSPEVIATFRHRFIEFVEQARQAVEEANRNASAVGEWLRREQLPHWKRLQRKLHEDCERARRDFNQARNDTHQHGKAGSIDEQKAYAKAKHRLEEVAHKMRATEQWLGRVEQEGMRMLQPSSRLSTLLAAEAPKAVLRLDQMLEGLDDYLRRSSSGK